MYKWSEYLEHFFKPIPHILSYQVFCLSSSAPGKVFLQTNSASSVMEVSIFRQTVANNILPEQLPSEIPLKGLSYDRLCYLYEHIREYCTTVEAADMTCPKPSCHQSNKHRTATVSAPPQNRFTGKKQRLCSVCRCPGHNKQSCSKK